MRKKEEKFTTKDTLPLRRPWCQLSLSECWFCSFWCHRRSAVIDSHLISRQCALTASSITVSTVHHQGPVNVLPVTMGIFTINQQIGAVIVMISRGLWSVKSAQDWTSAVFVTLDTGWASKGLKMRGNVWLVTTLIARLATDKLDSVSSVGQASSLTQLWRSVFRAQAAVSSVQARLPALSVIAVNQPWTRRQANVTAKMNWIGLQVLMVLVRAVQTSSHSKASACLAVKLSKIVIPASAWATRKMRRGCTWVPHQRRDQLKTCILRVVVAPTNSGTTHTRNSVASVEMLPLGARGVTRRQVTVSNARIISTWGGKGARATVSTATHTIRTASGVTIKGVRRVQVAILGLGIHVRTFGLLIAELNF